MMNKLEQLYETLTEQILADNIPWSKYVLLHENFKILPDDARLSEIKQSMIDHPQIKSVYRRLFDPRLGVPSIANQPASHKIYGSYYWGLRFLADIGLTANDLPFDEIAHQIFIHQLPDGQFTTSYHRKTKTPVTAVCLTAHLTYSLAKLGYQNSRGIRAAINYMVTTPRKDGGWHCDWEKQIGERDEAASSCPSANMNVIRVLALFGNRYQELIKKTIDQMYHHWKYPQANNSLCDFGSGAISMKLRYPPHYWSYDLLNVLDTVSMYPDFCKHESFTEMIEKVVSKWDGRSLLKSEKSIPEWQGFDFGKNNNYSCWISCLVCRILKRIYFS